MRYWESGFPFEVIEPSPNSSGGMKYWSRGFPLVFVRSYAVGATVVMDMLKSGMVIPFNR